MQPQEYENTSKLRFKFASIDEYGALRRDASDEYQSFFHQTPTNWSAAGVELVETRGGARSQAWLLRSESQELLAVAHETGIEFLLALGVHASSAAVIELVAWAWKRWREARAEGIRTGAKAEPTLVLESQDHFPDGKVLRSRKIEFYGPLDAASLAEAMSQWSKLV